MCAVYTGILNSYCEKIVKKIERVSDELQLMLATLDLTMDVPCCPFITLDYNVEPSPKKTSATDLFDNTPCSEVEEPCLCFTPNL